jgi:hypothetical protein
VWGIGGMILTGETGVLGENHVPEQSLKKENYHELSIKIRFVTCSNHIAFQLKSFNCHCIGK